MRLSKKIRYFFRLLITFFGKNKKVIFIGMVAGILVFQFWPRIGKIAFTKKEKRVGLTGRFTFITLPQRIQLLISHGLTEIDKNGLALPSLAESWKVENKGREYHFLLKKDLYWQDSTPIIAPDIDYNFSDVTTSFKAENEIVFQLKEPFSPFPSIVSQPVFKENEIGTGDYRVKNIINQGDFIEKLSLASLEQNKSDLTYLFYPSEQALITGFKLGEVDRIENLTKLGDLNNWPRVGIAQNHDFSRYVAIFINTQKQYLNEKSFRQALAYAIKKPWQERALSPINPNNWAYNPDVKPYDYNPDRAVELLENIIEGSESEENKINLELSVVPSLLSVAEAISQDWKNIGIDTRVKVINFMPEDYQALLVTQEIPPDPDQYYLWHSTQISNLSQYKNPKIDKLLEDGRQTFDLDKRKEIYFDFQQSIVEELPAIFLFHPTYFIVERE